MFGALTRSATRKSKNVHAESLINTTHLETRKQLLKSNCKKIVLPIDIGGHIYVIGLF